MLSRSGNSEYCCFITDVRGEWFSLLGIDISYIFLIKVRKSLLFLDFKSFNQEWKLDVSNFQLVGS